MTTDAAPPPQLPEILAKELVEVDPASLEPHPQNPNIGDVPSIAEAIKALDYVDPIIVQRSSNRILAGHHRVQAAQVLGMPLVPVIYVDKDDEWSLRYMLAANQTAKRSVYDNDILADVLGDLSATDDGITGTGFDDLDLLHYLGGKERG